MDCGIEPGYFPDINDPDYRFQLYLDWKNVRIDSPTTLPETFCSRKGIHLEELKALLKEFDTMTLLEKSSLRVNR